MRIGVQIDTCDATIGDDQIGIVPCITVWCAIEGCRKLSAKLGLGIAHNAVAAITCRKNDQ